MTWRVRPFLLAALLADASLASAEAALSVEIDAALRCPALPQLLAALDGRLAPLRVEQAANPNGRFHLTVQPHGSHGIAFTLTEHGRILVARTLEVAAHECDGLADALALIVEARLPPAAQDLESPDSVEQHAASVEIEVPEPESQSGTQSTAPERADTAMGRAEQHGEGRPELAPNRHPSDATEQARPAAPQPSAAGKTHPNSTTARHVAPHLALELASGVSVGMDQGLTPTAGARFGVEGAFDRWLLAVRGQLETAHAIDPGGAISIRHVPFELALGFLLARSTPELALFLGGGVDAQVTHVTRYENSGRSVAFVPLALSALRAALRPLPWLSVFAAAEFSLNLRQQQFASEGEPLGESARVRTRIIVGAAWRVF